MGGSIRDDKNLSTQQEREEEGETETICFVGPSPSSSGPESESLRRPSSSWNYFCAVVNFGILLEPLSFTCVVDSFIMSTKRKESCRSAKTSVIRNQSLILQRFIVSSFYALIFSTLFVQHFSESPKNKGHFCALFLANSQAQFRAGIGPHGNNEERDLPAQRRSRGNG